ncbi:alpha/beta fold hydrolase [Luteimonas suaedae]|uniref:alpha/beta fold hydrolase n=1 Tax=Luteimonas suaedae TaxID=2605430 RepID=UPI0011EC75ED|nr:alpha/beta hydrolase [Luteimonas suaedae]
MTDRATVRHQYADISGTRVFYRECGPPDGPVVLLPHGYPCSSYAFRALMPALGDRWRLLAPDFPGFGHSDTPTGFAYDFAGYTRFLEDFTAHLALRRYALYLHDYGSQIGLRLAMRHPGRVAALIVQNSDIYEDVLGPKYAGLLSYFDAPTPDKRAQLAAAVSETGYREEFLNEVEGDVAARIPPDLWKLHWALTDTRRREIGVALMEGLKENLAWFPRYQAYLREHRPPTLIAWGPRDGYMPAASARAWLRDLPDAELHLFDDGGHWLLETHLPQVVKLVRDFLGRRHVDAG